MSCGHVQVTGGTAGEGNATVTSSSNSANITEPRLKLVKKSHAKGSIELDYCVFEDGVEETGYFFSFVISLATASSDARRDFFMRSTNEKVFREWSTLLLVCIEPNVIFHI